MKFAKKHAKTIFNIAVEVKLKVKGKKVKKKRKCRLEPKKVSEEIKIHGPDQEFK